MKPKIFSGKNLILVYLSGFLLAVHYASVAYVNSSLLKRFVDDRTLGLFYIIGSLLSILFLLAAPLILRKFGNSRSLIIFVALEIFAVFGMGSSTLAAFILFLFLAHQAAESMLYFSLDVELERQIKIEGTTGGKRGAFLTAQNIAWVLSPFALSFLLANGELERAYFLSAAALVPLFFIALFHFKNVKGVDTKRSHMWAALGSLRKGGDKAKIIGAQFMLNFFFSWMIIYLPLLLNREVGFSWDKIGIILTVMLIPYLLFELPTGILADRRIGEKEALVLGFLVMSFSTLIIPFIGAPIFWLWAAVLFITRIGASVVEISSESYFFKHVRESDTGFISMFRMARPFSFIAAPLLSIPVLHFTGYSGSFLFLGIFTLLGLFFIPKKDTK
jgi:MFS family permease